MLLVIAALAFTYGLAMKSHDHALALIWPMVVPLVAALALIIQVGPWGYSDFPWNLLPSI